MSLSPPSSTVSEVLKFSELCGLLERVSRQRGTEVKKGLVKKFIADYREAYNRLHPPSSIPPAMPLTASSKVSPASIDSFFPVMRLILPQCDKSRVAYGIKEHTLAKHYIEILGLGKESSDAKKLLNYKSPKHAKGGLGDFAEVSYFVLKNRCPERGTLTIKDVNECLDSIADGYSNKRKEQVKQSLLRLLRNTSALEQKWLIRMLMKELKCGLSQVSVFQCFHEDAEALYDVTQDLARVCVQLHDPQKRLHEIAIALFQPFRPMLGDRGSPHKIMSQVDHQPFIVEVKFDGERVQLHKDGDVYRYWSRNGNEWTATYGASPREGNLTPYIDKAFARDVRNCILDGEMMGYNHTTNTMGSKAEDFDIKRTSTLQSSGYEPCFIVFDVVFLNDAVLTNKPLIDRKRLLPSIISQPEVGRIQLSEWKEGHTREDCSTEFNQAIDNREEGIMVKRADAVYSVATRKGGWYKLKPEYVIGLSDELDCLVVGGYFGSGHRAGLVAQFLCCVAENRPASGPEERLTDVAAAEADWKPSKFLSFCKVGTGYSKAILHEYNQRLAPHWQVFDKNRPPKCLVLPSGFKEKPDVWIEPSKSFIVQIRAAEFVSGDSYSTGFTLRFPRVDCFREDKSWYECATLAEVEEMRTANQGKMTGRHVTFSDGEQANDEDFSGEDEGRPSPKKRRAPITRTTVRPAVMSQFRSNVDMDTISSVSKLFEGKEICVMVTNTTKDKEEIERKILENGGNVVQNPGHNTFCVIADKISLKVKNLINSSRYDIVKPCWLQRCLSESRLQTYTPVDMIHTSATTRKRLAEEFDSYGDSYVEDVTPAKVRLLFQEIAEKEIVLPCVSAREMYELVCQDLRDPNDISERTLHDRDSGSDAELSEDSEEMTLPPLTGVVAYVADEMLIGEQTTRVADVRSVECRADLWRLGALMEPLCVEADEAKPTTTHVIVISDVTPTDVISELKAMNHSLEKKMHIVTEQWVSACLEDKTWKVERPFHVE